jgi:GNAT superfamily N-acetyltransferase
MPTTPAGDLMRLYIEFERRNFVSSFHTRDVHKGVTRFVSDSVDGSCILHHEFSVGDSISEIIADQIASFRRLGKNFEWKVYGTDEPRTLGDELIRQGLVEGDQESFMVLDLQNAPESLFSATRHDIRRITDRAGVAAAVAVLEQVWNESMEDRAEALTTELERSPASICIYAVYEDETPVASAWISFNAASPFAGLWGGSTLNEYRGRGCYRALLATRAREARARGVQFLTIDASPMSRPIVAQFGFEAITDTRPFEWRMRRTRSS